MGRKKVDSSLNWLLQDSSRSSVVFTEQDYRDAIAEDLI